MVRMALVATRAETLLEVHLPLMPKRAVEVEVQEVTVPTQKLPELLMAVLAA